ETTSIRKLLKTTPGNPLALPAPIPANEYQLWVTDYLGDGTGFQALDANPVVRLWSVGVVKATIRFETAAVDPTCTPCDWWDVGSLTSMGVFKPANTLG